MNKNEILNKLAENITPGQEWIINNLQYLTIMGSHAYGLNHKDSDFDVYGVTIPPIEYIYPTNSFIQGYDKIPIFNQFQFQYKQGPPKEHLDVTIYNITKYFTLCFDNNPNMIDSLYTPNNCVLFCSNIFKTALNTRHLFLHKGAYHKFKGYAFSQFNKIRTDPTMRKSPVRKELISKYGYDTKYALHLFRLLDECEQILLGHPLNLQQNKEQHKLVLKGIYSLEEIELRFKEKEHYLENLYNTSPLPWGKEVNQQAIRTILSNILKEFYDS